MQTILKGGRVIDPANDRDGEFDVLIEDGTIARVGKNLAVNGADVFEVRRGWSTNASAVAHIAACFLLPPGAAMAIAALGVIVRTIRFPLPLPKATFNIASIILTVGGAAYVATFFGGPDRVSPVQRVSLQASDPQASEPGPEVEVQ